MPLGWLSPASSTPRRFGMLAADGAQLAGIAADALSLLGRWDEALAMIAANRSVTDGVFGLNSAIVAARIALWQGRVDDADGHIGRAFATAGDDGDHEVSLCAAELAAARGPFDDARQHAATAFEAGRDSSTTSGRSRIVCAVAIGIEADRVEAARLGGRRSEADVEQARAVADKLLGRTHESIERAVVNGAVILPEAAAWQLFAEANHARVHGRSDSERWADVADQFEALALPHPAAIARYHEAEARLRSRSGHQQAAVAARAALATAEQLGAKPLADQVRLLAQRGRLDLTDPLEPAATEPDPLQNARHLRPRGRSAPTARPRAHQPADRQRALHQREDRQRPRHPPAPQARRREPGRGRSDRPTSRLTASN